MIDIHTHILPELDDGSNSVETSKTMMEMLHNQGITSVVATPHFHAHHFKTVEQFLEQREQAYQKLHSPKDMLLGAEVAIERGISQYEGIEQLAIQHTNLILLELPYKSYESWMAEEVHNIAVKYNLRPVIAHIHRYVSYYSKEDYRQVLGTNAIFQINNEAFRYFKERRFARWLIKQGYPIVFGSDCHNTSKRSPNWDYLKRKVKPSVIDEAMGMLKKHIQ